MPTAVRADRFYRIGSHVVPDFANTIYSPEDPAGTLRDARDVVAFLLETGLVAASDAASLRRDFSPPRPAVAFFATALRLRDVARDALVALESKKPLDRASLAFLNSIMRSDAGYDRIERKRGGAAYTLTYEHLESDPSHVLAPLARETAKLLATANPPVRRCAGENCVRHFYDDSRTKRRRWCEMAICGNRAKAEAFARRRRIDTAASNS